MRSDIFAVAIALVVVAMTAQEVASASNDAVDRAAQRASDTFNSDDFQSRVKTIRERLKSRMLGDEVLHTGQKDNSNQFLSPTERLYIFISSSIPETTIRRYLADLEKIDDPNAVVVMRGFVGGMVKAEPTLEFMKGILFKDESCDPANGPCELFKTGIQIDPRLFQRYGISKVPVVVYATGVTTNHPWMSEGVIEAASVGQSYIVYGDASLEYLLEQIVKDSKSQSLARMIARLKEGFFDAKR